MTDVQERLIGSVTLTWDKGDTCPDALDKTQIAEEAKKTGIEIAAALSLRMLPVVHGAVQAGE